VAATAAAAIAVAVAAAAAAMARVQGERMRQEERGEAVCWCAQVVSCCALVSGCEGSCLDDPCC
jgi:hypothetical protein